MGSLSTMSSFPIPDSAAGANGAHSATCRRKISPQAGRALEILGHAIEYLADEFVQAGGSCSAHDAQVEAMQLLMGINRQIYFDCPAVPSFGERWRALLHFGVA
ncbi:MAG: hypothetical protein ACLQG3_04820 [Terracidiphilus sp.]